MSQFEEIQKIFEFQEISGVLSPFLFGLSENMSKKDQTKKERGLPEIC